MTNLHTDQFRIDFGNFTCPVAGEECRSRWQYLTTEGGACGVAGVFWPDADAIEVVCSKLKNHEPENLHEDLIMGEWESE